MQEVDALAGLDLSSDVDMGIPKELDTCDSD